MTEADIVRVLVQLVNNAPFKGSDIEAVIEIKQYLARLAKEADENKERQSKGQTSTESTKG